MRDHPDILLETERLRLRRLGSFDLDDLVALDNDPEVMRYLNGGDPTPREVLEKEILPRLLRRSPGRPAFGTWAAVDRGTGAFLGWFLFRPRDGQGSVGELGYRLKRAAWGRGYATEGAGALVRMAFEDLRLHRVMATTYEENLASRRVLEKLGMTPIRRYRLSPAELSRGATFHAERQNVWDGEDIEYALDGADWERDGPFGAGPTKERS